MNMSTSGSQVVYEIHTLVVDGEIIDRRHFKYRTARGRIRPYLNFCLAPKAYLVMSFTLSVDRPDQRSLAALLYAAIMQSQEKPYGGIPDEIWLYSQIPVGPPLQEALKTLGITLRAISDELPLSGEVERFIATLKRDVWETILDYTGLQESQPEEITGSLTLREMEDAIRHYLTQYHQRVNSRTGISPLTFWQTHCVTEQADQHRLTELLGERIPRIVTHKGIHYQARRYWHDNLAELSPGTEVLICPTPSFSTPRIIEVFFQGKWKCSASVRG